MPCDSKHRIVFLIRMNNDRAQLIDPATGGCMPTRMYYGVILHEHAQKLVKYVTLLRALPTPHRFMT